MTRHHPPDDLLLELAAGHLPGGQALVVGVHLDGCAECRRQLGLMQALGGSMIEDSDPQALALDAWTRALERIDGPAEPVHRSASSLPAASMPPPPEGLSWPRRLRGRRSSRWIWMGPGMRFARLDLPEDPQAKLFLLRIGPGRSLPRHSHDGLELTQVLCGTFDDGRATFGPGDFDATDETILHQPVVGPDRECVCLAYVGNRLRFEGRVAALIGGWVGM
ncbi:MAG TPA: ChrR family anti-sigma-E factor [Burkholderiales bacterium]|nr:ChrR family anti-sigma-E factor [Burkholderiales bacterium]